MDSTLPEIEHPTTELLSATLDRQMASDEAREVDSHLLACRTCADDLAGLSTVQALVRALPEIRPPRSFLLPAPAAREPASSFRFPRLLVWTRAAAAVAAAFFGMFLTVDVVGTMAGAPASAPAVVRQAGPTVAAAPGGAPVMAVPTLAMTSAARSESGVSEAKLAETPPLRPPTPLDSRANADASVGTLTSAPPQPVKEAPRLVGASALRIATIGSGVLALGLIVAAVVLGRRDRPSAASG